MTDFTTKRLKSRNGKEKALRFLDREAIFGGN